MAYKSIGYPPAHAEVSTDPLLPTVNRGRPRALCTANTQERKARSAGKSFLGNHDPGEHALLRTHPKQHHRAKEYPVSPRKRDAKQHAKARQRRYLKAQERLERDRCQAQHAAEVLQQSLTDLGLPENLVPEIEGRVHSHDKLRGNIGG